MKRGRAALVGGVRIRPAMEEDFDDGKVARARLDEAVWVRERKYEVGDFPVGA